MSSGAQVAVLQPLGRRDTGARRELAGAAERPHVRLLAFAALGLYGVVRWATLMAPSPTWRLLGLLSLSLLLAALGPALAERSRALAAAAGAIAVLAAFLLSGVPLAWALHLRLAVTVDGIGQGLSALPRLLLPYNGINEWARVVIVLGAGVLLLDGALVLAFSGRVLGDLRRAAAALPLIALAVVPSTIVRPQLPYVHGLVLFALVAFFVWGERVQRRELATALALCSLAAAGAMVAAPKLERHMPWLHYQALAGSLAPAHVESFDWTQRYGPLSWPRTGREVLEVRAATPDYWKAQDLDLFDGRGWVGWTVDTGARLPSPDPSALSRWTQTLKVTIRSMKTTYLIAAGYASQPTNVPGEVLRGLSPGTWTSDADLGSGDTYLVQAYTPHPTPADLAAAGASYPAAALQGYLSLTMPQAAGLPAQQVAFAPFGSHAAPQNISDVAVITGTAAIADSPYARAFALASRLAASSPTPYAYATAIERFLSAGFRYDESPPRRQYPLASFLLADRSGYCQQFAGAMALLLRMGGVPARVATGFATGTYDESTRTWVVSDLDAHAWVEAWFPHYGWVRFDPTPAAAPARGGQVSLSALRRLGTSAAPPRPVAHRDSSPAPSGGAPRRRPGGSSPAAVIGGLMAALVLCALALLARRALSAPAEDQLLAELERAFARSGRPLSSGVTLAELERRFRASPGAAAYVRAIRLQRFAGATEPPTARQRRAIRTQLRFGLGFVGALRALWALPPWRGRADRRRDDGLGA